MFKKVVVSLEDFRAGRALERGRPESLVPEGASKDEKNSADDRRYAR